MKRIFVILTLSTVFALAGCNNQTQDLPEVSKVHVRITSTVATVTRPEETESESIPEATEEVIEQREGTTFRNTIWGDTKDEVKKYEKDVSLNDISDSTLCGETEVNGYSNTDIFYHFDNDGKLYEGVYGFNLNYSAGGKYIETYENIKTTMTKLYGNPTTDGTATYKSQDLIDSFGPVYALENGWMGYRTEWEMENNKISMVMASQNDNIMLGIQYIDPNYEPDINDSGL